MRQQAMSGRGENPVTTSGHGATPPIEVTPTTNGMGGAGTSAGDVPLADDDGTTYEGHLTGGHGGSFKEHDAASV